MGRVINKVVIITGASSGIGKACALEFFKQGARLMLAARSESKLIELVDFINNSGGQANHIVTDVSSETDCVNMINKTIDVYGAIDVLVNNLLALTLFFLFSLSRVNSSLNISDLGSPFPFVADSIVLIPSLTADI